MKKFEVGKDYYVNASGTGGVITIKKRTAHYITFTGDFSGRKYISTYGPRGLFGMGEHITIDAAGGKASYFCFAQKEVKDNDEKTQ